MTTASLLVSTVDAEAALADTDSMWKLDAADGGSTVPASLLAETCWQRSRRVRLAHHTDAGVTWCATRAAPYGPHDPRGLRIAERCRLDGCLDIFHDVLTRTGSRLRDRMRDSRLGDVADVERYVGTVVRSEVADLERRIRVLRGYPAKPTRTDGGAARVLAALRERVVDDVARRWYETLFRIVRAYPCRLERRGTEWPLDGLTAEKSKVDGVCRPIGSSRARAEVQTDIAFVLDLARDVLGRDWVNDNILRPLQGGGRPDARAAEDLQTPDEDFVDERLMACWFRDTYLRHRALGATREQAFARATRVVLGRVERDLDPELMTLLVQIEGIYCLGGRRDVPLKAAG